MGYALGIVVFTREVNLPLNRMTESWSSSTLPADWSVTRNAWNVANLWRAVWSALLFGLGLIALYLHALRVGCHGGQTPALPTFSGCSVR